LREALEAESFIDLMSPNGGLFFSVEYLSRTSLAELLETMVARRDKIDRSIAQLGAVARENYADADAAVTAVKRVIDGLDRGLLRHVSSDDAEKSDRSWHGAHVGGATRLAALREALKNEGFTDLTSPSGELVLSVDYLSETSLSEVLETMVKRREKIDRSFTQLGAVAAVARVNYADTVAVINAVRRVIDALDRTIP
jgi:hypothetical protein